MVFQSKTLPKRKNNKINKILQLSTDATASRSAQGTADGVGGGEGGGGGDGGGGDPVEQEPSLPC